MTVPPLAIEIALHYYARSTDYRDGDFTAPAVRDWIERMVAHGMLVPSVEEGRIYRPGPALAVYVDALCRTNWPVQKWVMETPA